MTSSYTALVDGILRNAAHRRGIDNPRKTRIACAATGDFIGKERRYAKGATAHPNRKRRVRNTELDSRET